MVLHLIFTTTIRNDYSGYLPHLMGHGQVVLVATKHVSQYQLLLGNADGYFTELSFQCPVIIIIISSVINQIRRESL